ncbi:DNA-binding domain-containing protein [Sedimentitalea sp. JM2-8]|uniref:DNA-binding domain-containing protein n=1 Tax=Sedimentitalea xiamensis TaxID=3050037 RepID=A0ABT7FDF1_9RHOB|nr:DNA-binding domain-containing protein [Sedimentitalea xiamensis]MDK3073149.1 DNA-binding domain-containing protein [Sedimentitalea xiamensis]
MTVSQTRFLTALLDPAAPVPDGLVDASGQPAAARFNVYRNNVVVSLRDAICVGFPIVTRLLGQENMDGIARMFVRAHPPSSPLLMHYGAEFPDFLSGLPQLSHRGFLPDVARLELALRHAYHAADAAGLDPAALADTQSEALLRSRVTLAPGVSVLRSDWPVYDIWRFNTQPDAAKPRHVAQDVLITRPEFDPAPNLLPPGGATWIAALIDGETVGSALDMAQRDCPDFDLTTCLALLLSGNALTSLARKD